VSATNKPHIVVVEDNPMDVKLFEIALAEVGLEYELTVFSDGGDALSWAQSPGENTGASRPPDLAVVDLNLPKYSGLDILSTMRRTSELSKVPVLVLSSSASMRDVARVRAFENTAYMTKPADLDQYVEIGNVVRRMLGT
jgi:DNA-binding response OmpR family regulator